MKNRIFTKSAMKYTFLLFSFFLITIPVFAQNWDYEEKTPIPITISHLDAELSLDEIGAVEGDLLYTLTFKDQNIDSLLFDAAGIEIIRTVINDDTKIHQIENDQLVIYMEGEYNRGEEVTLRIQYRAEPGFGLHHTATGIYHTSFLPKAVSHWLPVIDHPRVEFTAEFVVSHPAAKNLIINGRRGSTEILSVNTEVTTFTSSKPVTPGGIGFVMGDFERIVTTADTEVIQTFSGETEQAFQRRSDPQIHIYAEKVEFDESELISVAANTFSKLQQSLGVSFPHRDLHIMILEDSFWETKHYGSGLIFVYKNRGDIQEQIQSGILSQWIGVHIREEQWSNASALNLLKAYYMNQHFDFPVHTESSPEPYHVFDKYTNSKWRYYLTGEGDTNLIRNLEGVAGSILTENSKVLTWSDLSDYIYNYSGLNFFNEITPGDVQIEEVDSYEYLATMEWDEQERSVKVTFEAVGNSIDELVTVTVEEITFLDKREHELTFTGQSDTIVLSVSANIENVILREADRDDLILTERKPFQFWIYQLQNEEDPELRATAAAALSRFSDNPDLQLAFRDLFRVESDPEVNAEIIRSLSSITKGATGTEQTFLERTSNQQPKVIRIAAIEGLAYYPNNEQVISRLRSLINQTDDADIRRSAIRSLFEVTESEAFKNITESLITREAVLNEVPLLLQLLAEHGQNEDAVRFSSTFLAEGFPYHVRKAVLDLVIRLDNSESAWADRLPALLSDRDPRIRYQSVSALEKTGSSPRERLIQNRLSEEYDERVRRALLNNN
jgi:HEAT repeat protein